MHSATTSGAYVEHVGGGDRQGLAPDHALAVEAPGVDAEEQRGAARGQAGQQDDRAPLETGDQRDRVLGRSRGPSGHGACRPSATPSRGRGGAAARGPVSPSGARARGAPRARRTGPAAPRAAAARAPRRPGARRATTPTTARASSATTASGQRGSPASPRPATVVGSARTTGASTPARCSAAERDHDHAGAPTRTTTHAVRQCDVRPPRPSRPPGRAAVAASTHGEHDELGAEQMAGAAHERDDRQEPPHLDEPGEVERREQRARRGAR